MISFFVENTVNKLLLLLHDAVVKIVIVSATSHMYTASAQI